jgi:hypothetical protein
VSGFLALIAVAGCQRPVGGADARPSTSDPAPSAQRSAPSAAQFVDVTTEAGIRFRHTSGWAKRFYLAETLGSGCAFLDYNGDGRLDLFFVNSSRLPGFTEKGPFYPALYRNEGNDLSTGVPRFRDVTREAGLTIDCYGIGTAIADYDNDGDPDLLLTAYGGSHLFRNDRGRFIEVTRKAGVTGPEWGSSAAWFDYDRDGDLDLFIGNYVEWSPEKNLACGSKALRYACPPSHYPATASVLYRNNGDGTFADVTRAAKVDRDNGKALGVVVWDVDDDGWLDLAVANDAQPNWLYRSNRDGTFTEIGVEAGMAYGMQGRQRAGMGIDTADFDHSGREAILIGNLSGEGLALFRPTEAAGQFADRAIEAGLFQASLPYTTFGARFFDYDLDGYPDILTANGHVNEEVSANAGTFRYEQRLQLFHNEGRPTTHDNEFRPTTDGREGGGGSRGFRDVTASAGEAFAIERTWRGLAVGDVDGDGDPDVLLSANRGKAALLRNERIGSGATTHWLAAKLVGTKSNRDGIGARIRLTAGGQTQTGWVRSGGSYASEDERVARFGLGTAARVERLEIRWPTGAVQELHDLAADRVLLVREGEGAR